MVSTNTCFVPLITALDLLPTNLLFVFAALHCFRNCAAVDYRAVPISLLSFLFLSFIPFPLYPYYANFIAICNFIQSAMTASSPATRRSRQWSSPQRARISDFLAENRHTELGYQDALAAAQIEHERVRDAAIRVFKDHELQEECRRLQEQEAAVIRQQRREEERIRNEESLRAEEERLRALKAKTVPKLPPAEPNSPPVSQLNGPQLNGTRSLNSISATSPANRHDAAAPGLKPPPGASQQPLSNAGPTPPVNGTKVEQPVAPTQASPFATPTAAGSVFKPATFQPNPLATAFTQPKPPADQYTVIHQNLKRLRASLAEQAKSLPSLKARMGDMRRELRKTLGQMVTEKGGNRKQVGNSSLTRTILTNMARRRRQFKRYYRSRLVAVFPARQLIPLNM